MPARMEAQRKAGRGAPNRSSNTAASGGLGASGSFAPGPGLPGRARRVGRARRAGRAGARACAGDARRDEAQPRNRRQVRSRSTPPVAPPAQRPPQPPPWECRWRPSPPETVSRALAARGAPQPSPPLTRRVCLSPQGAPSRSAARPAWCTTPVSGARPRGGGPGPRPPARLRPAAAVWGPGAWRWRGPRGPRLRPGRWPRREGTAWGLPNPGQWEPTFSSGDSGQEVPRPSKAVLCLGYCLYAHCTDEETEARRGKSLAQGHPLTNGPSPGQGPLGRI